MRQTRILMGMPVTVDIVDSRSSSADLDRIYDYFTYVDTKFSPFKPASELSAINTGRLSPDQYSSDMRQVLSLCDETHQATGGYFNIRHNGQIDPSGLVKGWAIHNAAGLLSGSGFTNFFIDAGGDIEVAGKNAAGADWRVGIRDPFHPGQIVKVLSVPGGLGVATSGTYERGAHIYNPLGTDRLGEIISLTVIGPNIYEADRFATAAFAMGTAGIDFISRLPGFSGYMIDTAGRATFTNYFKRLILES